MTDVVTRTAGPASDTVPLGRFPVVAPNSYGPRDVTLFKPAQKDIDALPKASRKAVTAALDLLRAGRVRLEPKEREPLLGTFTIRVTPSLRIGVYLSTDEDWHIFWVGEHNYAEAERRFWNSPGYVRFAHPQHQQFRRAAGIEEDTHEEWRANNLVRHEGDPGHPAIDQFGVPVRPKPLFLDGHEVQVTFNRVNGVQTGVVVAYVNGKNVGRLSWYGDTIDSVRVNDSWQRRGIATYLLAYARWKEPGLRHSTNLTDEGRAWSERVAAVEGLTFTDKPGTWQGQSSGKHWVFAYLDGRKVGQLGWFVRHERYWEPGEIVDVEVDEKHRRQGIASAMLAHARTLDPRVRHSTVLTPEGRAWAEMVAHTEHPRFRRAAGLKGDLPEGLEWHHDEGSSSGVERHYLWCTHSDAADSILGSGVVGGIQWASEFGGPPTVLGVTVDTEWKRRGVATELLRRAREISPGLRHSTSLSPDGKAWAEHTAANWVRAFSGTGERHYTTYSKPYIGVGIDGPIGSARLPDAKVDVPWEGDLRNAVDEATDRAKHLLATDSFWANLVKVKNPTVYLIAGSQGTSRVLGTAKAADLGRHWGPPAKFEYTEPWPGFLDKINRDPKAAWTQYCMEIADAQPPGYDSHPALKSQPEHRVTIYRGLALGPGENPATAIKEGQGGLGSSWTLDERSAKAIAERGGAGFGGDNAGSGARIKFKAVPGRYSKETPVVIRAEVDLNAEGVALFTDGRMFYASEQEVDVQRGTKVKVTGYAKAVVVPESAKAKADAEKAGRDDPYSDAAYYWGTYRWGPYTGGGTRTAALDPYAGWRPTGGMFEPGRPDLDPRVFTLSDEHMRNDVLVGVLADLDMVMRDKYPDWRDWTTVYLAGSGASHWWDSDFDLDILLGLDLPALVKAYPANEGLTEVQVCVALTAHLMAARPLTAARWFAPDSGPWDETFFYNPGSHDIRAIRPYAAYDLLADDWVQQPPALGPDWGPASLEATDPGIWARCEQVAAEANDALAIKDPGARAQACIALFDMVHAWRHLAYTPAGKGWLDFGNVLYQYLALRPDKILRRLYLEKHPEPLAATASRSELHDLIIDREYAMTQGGLDGRTWVLDNPGAIERARSFVAEAVRSKAPWLADKITVEVVTHLPDDVGGWSGSTRVEVPVRCSDLTLLHEAAHLIAVQDEQYGHSRGFAETARDLYAAHLGERAAAVFWDPISGFLDSSPVNWWHIGAAITAAITVDGHPVGLAEVDASGITSTRVVVAFQGIPDGEGSWTGFPLGVLTWDRDAHTVEVLYVSPDARRKGLARRMWEFAKTIEPRLVHSTDRTPEGDAWARSVGDDLPGRDRHSTSPGQVSGNAGRLMFMLSRFGPEDVIGTLHQAARHTAAFAAVEPPSTLDYAGSGYRITERIALHEGTGWHEDADLDRGHAKREEAYAKWRKENPRRKRPERYHPDNPWVKSGYTYFTQENTTSGTVAFVDLAVSGDRVSVAYAAVRPDMRGRGLARQLMQAVYDRYPKATIHWGKIMQPQMGHLYEQFKRTHPDQTGGMSRYWGSLSAEAAITRPDGLLILEKDHGMIAIRPGTEPQGQITWVDKYDEDAYSDDDEVAENAKGDHHGHYLEIDHLVVYPAFRRQGVGTALLEEFIKYAERWHGKKGWDPGEFTAEGAAFWKAVRHEDVPVTKRMHYGSTEGLPPGYVMETHEQEKYGYPALTVLVKHDGSPVAALGVYQSPDPRPRTTTNVAHVEAVQVYGEHQRKGLATAMYAEVHRRWPDIPVWHSPGQAQSPDARQLNQRLKETFGPHLHIGRLDFVALAATMVDYKPDRPLTGTGSRTIASLMPNTHYGAFNTAPWQDALDDAMRTSRFSHDVGAYMAKRKAWWRNVASSWVSLNSPFTVTQRNVNMDRVAQIRDHPQTGGKEPIWMVRWAGRLWVLNGHHRLVAEWARGEDDIEAKVVDGHTLRRAASLHTAVDFEDPEASLPEPRYGWPTKRGTAALWGAGTWRAMFGDSVQTAGPWPFHRFAPGSQNKDAVRAVIANPGPHMEMVDPRVLRATQGNLTRAGVAYYLYSDYARSGRTFADRENPGNQVPVIYHTATGQYVILAGHHRAAAALLRGQMLLAAVVEEAASDRHAALRHPFPVPRGAAEPERGEGHHLGGGGRGDRGGWPRGPAARAVRAGGGDPQGAGLLPLGDPGPGALRQDRVHPADGVSREAVYFMHDVNEPLLDVKPMTGFEEKASFDFVHPQIATGGALRRASDVRILARRGVTAIISGRRDYDDALLLRGQPDLHMATLYLPTPDDGTPKPTSWFKAAIDFALPRLRRGEKVYVHCHAGMNRGPSLCYAVLRAYTGMSHAEAMRAITSARSVALVGYAGDADRALHELGYTKERVDTKDIAPFVSLTSGSLRADTLLLTDGTNALEYAAADGEPLILAAAEGAPDGLLAELREAHPGAVIVPGTVALAESEWWGRAQYTAGKAGDLPEGLSVRYTMHKPEDLEEDDEFDRQWRHHRFDAMHGGESIGYLIAEKHPSQNTSEVWGVEVDPRYRRRGVAGWLLAQARSRLGEVHHTENLTDEGRAWSEDTT